MMPTLEQTLQLVIEKHKGQMYNDEPYVFHLIRVASQVEGYHRKTIALLHDILEDTNTTIDELLKLGYDRILVGSVVLLTHQKNDSYDNYIYSLFKLEREIKLADINDHFANLHKVQDDQRKARLQAKYTKAWHILNTREGP
jgi:hypothetical protein